MSDQADRSGPDGPAHQADALRRIRRRARRSKGEVIELGQKLFRDACGPEAPSSRRRGDERIGPGRRGVTAFRTIGDDEDQPMRLVHRLQTSVARAASGCWNSGPNCAGCWNRAQPWLAPDKLKAVRLLGRHPIDAIDCGDVARMYLASHVLLNQEGDPFQEILNELYPKTKRRPTRAI